ncbi:nitroreductase family protein [Candidatus Margulisiibacteriota bacterium]
MDFYNVIANRRSIRDFDPQKQLSDETLNRILTAGRIAPSATNAQPWRFIVAKSPRSRAKINKCYLKDWFHDAPLVLIVAGSYNKCWTRADGYQPLETDLAIAMDHMILAAEAEGVGTCWIANFEEKVLNEALGLGETEKVFCITPLGYSRDGYVKKQGSVRKELAEIVEII